MEFPVKFDEAGLSWEIREIVMVMENVTGYAKIKTDSDEGVFHLGEVMRVIKEYVAELGWDGEQVQMSTVHPMSWGAWVHVYFYTQEFLDEAS